MLWIHGEAGFFPGERKCVVSWASGIGWLRRPERPILAFRAVFCTVCVVQQGPGNMTWNSIALQIPPQAVILATSCCGTGGARELEISINTFS